MSPQPRRNIGPLASPACLLGTATSTRVFTLLTRDDLHGDAGRIEDFGKEEDKILYEDLTILERYGDSGLPLDTRAVTPW
jgi:hypothetical protein